MQRLVRLCCLISLYAAPEAGWITPGVDCVLCSMIMGFHRYRRWYTLKKRSILACGRVKQGVGRFCGPTGQLSIIICKCFLWVRVGTFMGLDNPLLRIVVLTEMVLLNFCC